MFKNKIAKWSLNWLSVTMAFLLLLLLSPAFLSLSVYCSLSLPVQAEVDCKLPCFWHYALKQKSSISFLSLYSCRGLLNFGKEDARHLKRHLWSLRYSLCLSVATQSCPSVSVLSWWNWVHMCLIAARCQLKSDIILFTFIYKNYWRIFEVVRVKNLGQALLPVFLSLLFSVFSPYLRLALIVCLALSTLVSFSLIAVSFSTHVLKRQSALNYPFCSSPSLLRFISTLPHS